MSSQPSKLSRPLNSTASGSAIPLSVIVPVYNIEPIAAYFKICIASVRAQTFDNIEIIIVDDGSTDGTHQYISEVASQDERIVVIRHTDNRGLGPARNSATVRARGEYVWYVDGDDFIPPSACALLVKQIEQQQYPDVLCFEHRYQGTGEAFEDVMRTCVNRTVPKSSVPAEVLSGDRILKHFFVRKISHGPCFRITRTKIARAVLFEPILLEDVTHSLHIYVIAQRVIVLPYLLYGYRVHATSIMASLRNTDTSTGCAEYAQVCHAVDRIIVRYHLDTRYPRASVHYRLYWRLKHMLAVLEADDVIYYKKEWHDLFSSHPFSVRSFLLYWWRFYEKQWRRPLYMIDTLILPLLFRSSVVHARRYYRWRQVMLSKTRRL